MSWKQIVSEHIAGILRFTGYVFLAFDVIVLSVFSFWFVAKFLWHLAKYLNRVLFDGPW